VVFFYLALALAVTAGVALRLWPLTQSPLPFNPDGIVYAGHVDAALARGSLPLGRLAVDELQFTAFLAVLELVTGNPARYVAQPAIAVVGVLPVVVVAAATRAVASGRGGWARPASALAALLLAIEGLYLHRSMAVDEQTLGLFLVPLAAYSLARARQDHRWLVALAAVLLALPATHNLDSVVLGLVLVASAAFALARGATLASALALGGGAVAYWLYLAGFTLGVAELTPATVVQSARLTEIPGLLVAWLVLASLAGAWFLNRRARTQRLVLFGVFGAWFALLGANAVVPIFPEMPATNPRILVGVSVLVVPAAVAAYGVPVATRRDLALPFVALVAAVGAFVGVSLTASLTPEYLNTVYRAQTFVHLPVLLFAALGVAALATRFGLARTSPAVVVLCAVLLVTAAASIPVAYGGLGVVPYEGVTTEAEFAASSFAVERVPGEWASDDHLSRITRYYGPNASYTVLPVYAWLTTGAGPPSCPVLSQRSWTTTGAQFYPKAPATAGESAYRTLRDDRHVVYAAGGPDTLILSTPQFPTPGC